MHPKNKRYFASKKTSSKKRKLCDLKTVEKHEEAIESEDEESDIEFEKDFEKRPRKSEETDVYDNYLNDQFLPLKGKNGLISHNPIPKCKSLTSQPAEELPEKKEVSGSLSFLQHYANQQKYLTELKNNIAVLSTSVVENPEENMRSLKTLIIMLEKPKTAMIITEKKLLALSLLRIFSDILPGYKIRTHDENEQKTKLKKETKHLVAFESCLLRNYKKYLNCLQQMIREMKLTKKSGLMSAAKKKALHEIGLTAVKCMCDLLVTQLNFNYFKSIVNILVPLAAHRKVSISDCCCAAIVKSFKADKLGEASLEIVKQICKVLKERKFCVPGKLLQTFQALNIKNAKVNQGNSKKKDMKKIRRQMSMMSRKEKQHSKKMQALEHQLREVEAQECQENKSKFHTEILNKIFWVYFHVIKDHTKISLLSPVLEGLATFAHLINLEYFDDLNSVLCGLMSDGDLKDIEKLHCMQTIFIILSGHAESLNIDPQALYCHLYRVLLNLQINTSDESFLLTLKCLDLMIIKRKKKITSNRVLAFVKRLCTMALQTPVAGTVALLCMVKHIMTNFKNCDILLDLESIGSGVYFSDLEDPEHCNAHSTSLWELHVLQQHNNPVVCAYAKHILHGCPVQGRFCLSEKLCKLLPEDALRFFSRSSTEDMGDTPKLKKSAKQINKRKYMPRPVSDAYNNNVTLEWCDVKEVDFSKALREIQE